MTMRKLPAGGAWTPMPVNFKDNSIDVAIPPKLVEEDVITAVAFSFIAPVSGTLDTFLFFMDAGAADPDTTLNVAFYSVDSDDLPDTQGEFRVIRVGDYGSPWINPGLMTSDGTDTGTKRSVTRGEKLMCVFEFDASNPGDIITFGVLQIGDDTFRSSFGNWLQYGGSWDRQGSLMVIFAALKYDADPAYFPMPELLPINALQPTTINTGTTPDEVGLEFAFPAPVMIGGASMCLSTSVDGATFDCVVYDQSSNVLDTVPMILHTALFPASGYSYWTARFSYDIPVPGNEPYKITVKPSSTDSVKLLELAFADSLLNADTFGYLDTGGNEHDWQHVHRTDSGDWQADPDQLPLISLNITGVDMDAGGATDDWEGDA